MSIISIIAGVGLISLVISILIFLFDSDPNSSANVMGVVMFFVLGLTIAISMLVFIILIGL